MEPTVNARNVKNPSQLKDWRFIQLLKTAWNVNKPNRVLRIALITLIVLLDQTLKHWAVHKNLPVWKIFADTVCNPNLSLGFYLNPFLFWSGWLLAFTVLFFTIHKAKDVFLILVLAGALSNLIDRLFLKCVIDYISIFNFPIFNLADFFISFGFLLFGIRFFQKRKLTEIKRPS